MRAASAKKAVSSRKVAPEFPVMVTQPGSQARASGERCTTTHVCRCGPYTGNRPQAQWDSSPLCSRTPPLTPDGTPTHNPATARGCPTASPVPLWSHPTASLQGRDKSPLQTSARAMAQHCSSACHNSVDQNSTERNDKGFLQPGPVKKNVGCRCAVADASAPSVTDEPSTQEEVWI